jgi:hypothetical protein
MLPGMMRLSLSAQLAAVESLASLMGLSMQQREKKSATEPQNNSPQNFNALPIRLCITVVNQESGICN